jgi:hypothetical protein
MSQMHEVIAQTDAPSWLGSVPNKLGEVSMATVKAAQWRVLCTVYLPMALESLIDGVSHDTPDDASARPRILDHTMYLLSVCYWFMTTRRVQDYLKYIK